MSTLSMQSRILWTALLVAVGLGVRPIEAQRPTPVRQPLMEARRLLEIGSNKDAVDAYTALLESLPASDATSRAASYFGRGLARQQLAMDGDSSSAALAARRADYGEAVALDGPRFQVAAFNNMGLVASRMENHRAAAALFTRAASVATDNREAYWWSAGREYEALSQIDSARASYRRALTIAPKSDDNRRALYSLFARNYPAESLLVSARAERDDTSSARAVNDALLALLVRREPAVAPDEARRSLVLLAATWPKLGVGPVYFASSLRDPLGRAAKEHTDLAMGIDAVTNAYMAVENDKWSVPASSRWWRSDRSRGGAFATWSALLRSIGDAYYQQRNLQLARQYYEAALDVRGGGITDPEVDRSALLPLALIYGKAGDSSLSTRLDGQVDQLSEALFMGKAAAYQARDLERIRSFHMTLGALYAARGEWSGTGPRTAEYQLEHMRQASEAITRETGRKVVDPPELLEKLGAYYRVTGNAAKASVVKSQLVRQYREAGRSDSANVVVERIDKARVIPRKVVPKGEGAGGDARVTSAVDASRRVLTKTVPAGLAPGRGVVEPVKADSSPGRSRVVPAKVRPGAMRVVPRDTVKDTGRVVLRRNPGGG